MKPLKALIVEDNALMAEILSDLLIPHKNEISVMAVVGTGNEAVKVISEQMPDVVFLDIELPDMNGFELLQQLEEIKFKTIFTTSHSHYAIKAFRFNALDYLEKPIKEVELGEAVKRLLLTSGNKEDIKNALSNLEAKSVENQKLMLATQSGTLRLALKDITHIMGERNYSFIYLANGEKKLSSKHLAFFEEVLSDKGFFRSHRSFLVNQYHVEAYLESRFLLKNGVEIPLSRRNKSEGEKWYQQIKNNE